MKTPEEFKKSYIQRTDGTTQFLFLIKVSQIKIGEPRYGGGYKYKTRDFNPLNPLSYIMLVFFLSFMLIHSIFTKILPEIKRSFSWR